MQHEVLLIYQEPYQEYTSLVRGERARASHLFTGSGFDQRAMIYPTTAPTSPSPTSSEA